MKSKEPNEFETTVENLYHEAQVTRRQSMVMKLVAPLTITTALISGYAGYHDRDAHKAEMFGVEAGFEAAVALISWDRARTLKYRAFDLRVQARNMERDRVRDYCLGCPNRPDESPKFKQRAEDYFGKDYRAPGCAVGPQVAVSHTFLDAFGGLGYTGLGYGRQEMACGKEGVIEEPEQKTYVNSTLLRIMRGGKVLFYDKSVEPKPDPHVTQADYDSYYSACDY